MAQPQFHRSGKLWYVSDGLIRDKLPAGYRRDSSHPLECSSKLLIYNPNRRAAKAAVTFHHTDRPATSVKSRVPARKIAIMELAALAEIPHNQAFWIAVESDLPVLPQAVHEDYTGWDPVPDSLIAVAPYPGPLADETRLVFPDCFNMAPCPGFSWYEQETLSILNPSPHAVSVRVRYFLRTYEADAEETVEIPAQRVAQIDVWARSPRPIGQPRGAPVRMDNSYEYVVHLDATAPVVAQTTRRARWAGRSDVIGSRTVMGFPVRSRKRVPWYYPGGAVLDYGVLPRAKPNEDALAQCDNTWNLLFLHNLHERESAQATVSFHHPDGSRTVSEQVAVPPRKSAFQCLHAAPWLGTHTHVDEPYAMTVTADKPVVPEVTAADFEMWSQVCPGAMTAVNFYPGPLTDEKTWWLGIGQAGGRDDTNVEWRQAYHLFNAGARSTTVTLSFLGLSAGRKAIQRTVEVPAGAVAMVNSRDVEGLPMQEPFAVCAEGTGPFCAQVFSRTFTRGAPAVRASSSFMGLPMTLASPARGPR